MQRYGSAVHTDIDLKKVIISEFFGFNFEMHSKSLRNGKTGGLEKKIKDNTVGKLNSHYQPFGG